MVDSGMLRVEGLTIIGHSFELPQFILGSEAEGNKRKEIALGFRD